MEVFPLIQQKTAVFLAARFKALELVE